MFGVPRSLLSLGLQCYTPLAKCDLDRHTEAHLAPVEFRILPPLRTLLRNMAVQPSSLLTRKRITVRGVVQGVGFRPYAYNLAQRLLLSGFILNTSAGLLIEVEGDDTAVDEFVHTLRRRPPSLSQIADLVVADLNPCGDQAFAIRESIGVEGEFALVPSDVGTCADCWHDFSDPTNRRYGYAFTNCTNCGPRYSIIQDIPYDRRSTTMSNFQMCALCRAEYNDPTNRRFHAEPNACPACGPQLALCRAGDSSAHNTASMAVVRNLLQQGNILAVKGLGGFLLACDAENDSAVRQLRERKRKSDKPFALMARDVSQIQRFCLVSDADHIALTSARRPIVVMPRIPESTITSTVAPGNNTLGVMLPYTPLHYLLFSDSPDQPAEFAALVMTSGNLSEEPIVTSNEEALDRLRDVADWFLLHNRDIYMRVDDSVTRTFGGQERVLRRSRGYVPQAIDLKQSVGQILACGAELKNTFCLTKDHYAILSQHIGDLENYETLEFFRETLHNLKKLYRVAPEAVAYDLHPRYMSSRFALELPIEYKIGVQHHHAHVASCMAENQLDGKVIGVAFDGTGYGTDGKVWGGDFLVADYAGFVRRAHLRYVPLPGGDAAVRQPWRMALSYLRDCFGPESLPQRLPFLRNIPQQQIAVVDAMMARGINAVDTSSCGRLFDAVASLTGIQQEVTFEGQAAIALEMAAAAGVPEHYPFEFNDGEPAQIDVRLMIRNIVEDVLRARPAGEIAARFHNTVAEVILDVSVLIRKSDGLNRVCLSGGTFQNHYLLERAINGLKENGFEVFIHAAVPPNDGGISLGQAVIANEILRKGN
jgi:hydrogenase maturation protein HypF